MAKAEAVSIEFTQEEREFMAVVLMGEFDLMKRLEQATPDGQVSFTLSELQLLDEVLAIELDHIKSASVRNAGRRIRIRIGRILSL